MAQPAQGAASAYDFYYWPLPFRGQFIRAILAFAGQTWDEHDAAANEHLRQQPPAEQPIPFMGPPLLIDRQNGFAQIAELLERTAPVTAALSRRLQQTPALAALSERAWAQYGDSYCGGQIEASMRRMIGPAPAR